MFLVYLFMPLLLLLFSSPSFMGTMYDLAENKFYQIYESTYFLIIFYFTKRRKSARHCTWIFISVELKCILRWDFFSTWLSKNRYTLKLLLIYNGTQGFLSFLTCQFSSRPHPTLTQYFPDQICEYPQMEVLNSPFINTSK